MKTLRSLLAATLALPLAASAAPRIVPSTPSLAPESTIDLVLDHDAVKPGDLGKEVDNTWLNIQPPLPGTLVWKAGNIATFTPSKSPEIATTYTFSLPKKLKYLDQSAVPAGEITKLNSEPFRILTATSQNRWASGYSASTAEWTIVFNDDVDPAKLSKSIFFTSKDGTRIAAKVLPPTEQQSDRLRNSYRSWSSRFTRGVAPDADGNIPPPSGVLRHLVVASPSTPLPAGENWKIIVAAGIPNATGKAKLPSAASYEIGTIAPFACTSLEARVAADTPRTLIARFNHPVPDPLPADFLTKSVELSPLPENLTLRVEGQSIIFEGDFSTSDKWNLTIRPPFASAAGLALVAGNTAGLEFERVDPELLIASFDQAQLAGGNRTYPVRTVNLSKLTVRIKRLAGNDLIRAYQGFRHYSGDGPEWSEISPTAPLPWSLVGGDLIAEKEIVLDNPIDTSKEITLDWNEILPKELRHGALFVDIVGAPHAELPNNGRRNAQSIVQLTDIGLAWKITEKEAVVYSFSCLTGQPLPGVKLEMFGEDSKALESFTTDASGLARLPRPAEARHLRASLADDTYLTAFDTALSTVGTWHFPIRYSWGKPLEVRRKAFLFTDRSLYRPGETVRLKGIVRSQRGNGIEEPDQAPARLRILDPTDKEIHTGEVKLSANGSFDLTYTLPALRTGSHRIVLEYPEDLARAETIEDWYEQEALQENATFELPLRVEEFRRNAFEVEQSITPPDLAATSVETVIDARYYQGQPVASGKVKHFTRVAETNLYPERFRDFQFGNHRTDDWSYWYHYFGYRWDSGRDDSGTVQNQGETTLNEEGKALVTTEIPSTEFPRTREVTISSEVTDANNQTLTEVTTATVHPAAVYVGISRNDRLVKVNQEVPLRIVAITPDGEPFTQPVKVTATLSRSISSTVKAQNEQGETTTRSDTTEETVSTQEITIDPAASARDGQPLPITPTTNGLHFLTVRGLDPEGRPFATVTRFHVYGTNEFPWQYEDGLRIRLVAEKKSYQPGDTARVLVLSPIEGTALVTIEREKVLRSFMVPLKADNPVVEIPLTDDDAPNAFVSVLIVKGANDSARDHKEPQLRLGYCELIIEPKRERLNVAVNASAADGTVGNSQPPGATPVSFRPGDKVTLTGSVKLADGAPAANAEVTLYAEDEGTLAVMGYETPNPIDHFYRPRFLDVETGISLDHFLAEDPDMRSFFNKGFFIGGGGDSAALEQKMRKNFDPCATWAPSLITDAEGRFTHTFTAPDTLTRYRVIAVAHHQAARFGSVESAIVVNKPLMLEPKAPRFAHQGDQVTPRVLVQNASEFTGTWEIRYQPNASSGTPVCSSTVTIQTITLEPGKSGTVDFPTLVENTGEAVFQWQAVPVSLGGGKELTAPLAKALSDAVEIRLPVAYPMPLLRQNKSFKLDKPGTPRDLLASLDKDLLGGTGNLELELCGSRLSEAAGSIDYLLSYPHGCVEQTTSSLMPWFAVKSLAPHVPRFASTPPEKIKAAIQSGADRLISMQLGDGSFSYWPGSTERVDWATAFAGMGLILARENGASVPESSITKLTEHLITNLRGLADIKNSWELETQSRALWVLSLAGKPQPAYHATLIERLGELTPTARHFLALAVAGSGEKNANTTAKAILASKVPTTTNGEDWMPYQPNAATSLLAWSTIDPNGPQRDASLDQLLNDRNPFGHWRNTWVNGWSLLALAEYAKHEKTNETSIAIILETAEGSETINLNADQLTATRVLTLEPGMKLVANPNETCHVRLKLAAKPQIQPTQPVSNNGMSVERFYELVNADGTMKPLDQPAPGDLIRVSLRVTLPADNTRYLVIEDPLPATFETVNTDFASQRAAAGPATSETDWNISHSELRSDRAVFYFNQVWRKGTYTITYLARCTVPGKVTAPPAKVESMYDPEQFALSASREFTTRD